ncbi:hypothetical protein CP533_1251 [Ophiocordyceps camponoti-saundersi (nom. inval.)]|nr:hypothetical protein CP533_1251 [Ophiocordyceps camponoti-saundersi (nom. inval.)]
MEKTSQPKRHVQVLALGLPRTGTYSTARALSLLGYHKPFHGMDIGTDERVWNLIEQACDASFPALESYHGEPFTREQWDSLFGESEAVTDIGGLFARQLIEAYPEAHVILTIRDFDPWYKSIDGLVGLMWNPLAILTSRLIDPLLKTRVSATVRKLLLGFFEAKDATEARRNARRIYDRHNREVRELVPEDRLLVYRMGQGWEPLCTFLNKPLPDVDFPRINDSEALATVVWEGQKASCAAAAKLYFPWVAAATAAAALVMLFWS